MSKHTVYISTGEIIEYTGGRASFRRKLSTFLEGSRWMSTEPVRYWFRPTEEWTKASNKHIERWKKTHRTPWSYTVGEVWL